MQVSILTLFLLYNAQHCLSFFSILIHFKLSCKFQFSYLSLSKEQVPFTTCPSTIDKTYKVINYYKAMLETRYKNSANISQQTITSQFTDNRQS